MRASAIRMAVAIVVAVALPVFFSEPVAAAGGNYASGYAVYFAGTSSGGQIQCGGRYQIFNAYSNSNTLETDVFTSASKDLFCTNRFTLPAGWVQAGVTFQRYSFQSSRYVTVDSVTNVALPVPFDFISFDFECDCGADGRAYRSVSGHNVLLLGNFRFTLNASPVFDL